MIRAILLACCLAGGIALAADPGPLGPTEALFLDFLDARDAVAHINSGYVDQYEGRKLDSWDAQLRDKHKALLASLAALDSAKLTPADTAAVAAIRVTLADFGDPSPAIANAPNDPECKDRNDRKLDYEGLSAALSSCYREIGNQLKFENGTIDRGGALGMLYDLEEPARRKALFDAFLPLWAALNGNNEPDSPYRRLIKLAAAAEATNGSGVEAAARAIGVTVPDVERWLVQILEAWRDATGPEMVEPWDYRYAVGEANRKLKSSFPGGDIVTVDHRFYADLGVDLDALGVVYDIKSRPDKSPLAYTDFLKRGKYVDGEWQKTIAFVVGRYEDGDLGSLNELVHENGHAVHISAIRNRPAYTDWTDTLFTEAFADVPSWSVYEPAWQKKYLGTAAPRRHVAEGPARQRDDGHRLVAVRDPDAARSGDRPERALDRHHPRVPAHQAAPGSRVVGRARAAREPAGVHGELRSRRRAHGGDPQGDGRGDRSVRCGQSEVACVVERADAPLRLRENREDADGRAPEAPAIARRDALRDPPHSMTYVKGTLPSRGERPL